MALEAGLIAYAGLAGLAASRQTHPRAKPAVAPLPPAAMRLWGTALLCLSLLTAILRFGGPIGVVAWAGQMSIAGVALVLLLSWRPRFAFSLAAATIICGVSIAFL